MAATRFSCCLLWNQAKHSKSPLTSSFCAHPLFVLPRRGFREFCVDVNSKKLSPDDVNKRIFENEFCCFPRYGGIGFTANQVNVNRPVEDRWSAFRIGGAMCFESVGQDTLHPLHPFVHEFAGGHLFSVIDGHAGHTCAHAVNFLHADYVTVALLPQHLKVPVFHSLCRHEVPDAPPQATVLAQPYLTDPEARMTTYSSSVEGATTAGPFSSSRLDGHCDRHANWRPWGQWGPLDATVNQRRVQNLHLMLKEQISATEYDDPSDCVLHSNGNVYDREGFLVSEGSEFSSTQLEHIAATASALRRGLARMDSDITADAVPYLETGLNKPLLRIVLSGCVATSVYITDDLSSLYVAQVGDCGAVLGQFTGQLDDLPNPLNCDIPPLSSPPSSSTDPPSSTTPIGEKNGVTVDRTQWKAELLVAPHNAQNLQDVERLQSQHPIHEANLLIVEDRLLCELMPLRAFGDIRYKIPAKVLRNIAKLLGLPPSYSVTPRFYTSPPYLFATPQIVCRRLDQARDKFIILGTDGLWDMLSPEDAVSVVAQHYLDYNGDPSLAGPRDTAASRLIRAALGGGPEMDSSRIASLLCFPANVARFYRDDITVQVVYPTHYPR